MNYDIFNGDADGICALHQLRLDKPAQSKLVTGVKRDISLVKKVKAKPGDKILVLDISFDKNKKAILDALEYGAQVKYYDHHYTGDMPENINLKTFINTSPEVCTSLIVNQQLKGKYAEWAVVAAFGDNLAKQAKYLARKIGLSKKQTSALNDLGILLNYNGYGSTLDDLFFTPDDLYLRVHQYVNPHEFIESEDTFTILQSGYYSDLANAEKIKPEVLSDKYSVFIMPNEVWARRISGVYGNMLAQQNPERAHAILTEISDNNYVVSVRSPLNNQADADDLCRQFKTGGGRKSAAGINKLAFTQYDNFINKFIKQYT